MGTSPRAATTVASCFSKDRDLASLEWTATAIVTVKAVVSDALSIAAVPSVSRWCIENSSAMLCYADDHEQASAMLNCSSMWLKNNIPARNVMCPCRRDSASVALSPIAACYGAKPERSALCDALHGCYLYWSSWYASLGIPLTNACCA